MKRLNCTVFDKRGVNGDCMEFHAKGKYLRYTEANSRIEELVSKCDKQEKRIAELEEAVNSALYGTLLDKYGNRDVDGLYGFPINSRISNTLAKALKGHAL
jgi:hypothetical protein